MKRILLLISTLSFLQAFSQKSSGPNSTEKSSGDMAILVDGKHFTTIPEQQRNNYTVSIPLPNPGLHVIQWTDMPNNEKPAELEVVKGDQPAFVLAPITVQHPVENKKEEVTASVKSVNQVPASTVRSTNNLPAILPSEISKAAESSKDLPIAGRVDKTDRVIEMTLEEKDSIRIDIYDNGVIDNDSISVFEGNQIRISKKKVSTTPLTFYVHMSELEKTKLIKMEAQNLGLIPPNTSVMQITTKKNKYIVPLTSDLKKNAVVEFVLQTD
jgi:hypothetical protein